MENVQSKENQIISGVIWKQLLIFFFPIVLGTFFQQIYNTADAVVVGRFVGTEALAAVGGSTSQIINLIVGFFVGLSSGATVVISQYYGAREKQGLQNALHTAFAFSVVGSVVISVIGIWLSPMMLRWMNTTEEVIAPSTTYLRIYFAGIIFVFIYNVGSSILRAVGDSRRPLYYLIVCCFINILLDVVLVVFFHMGVAGAAIATVFAQGVSAVLVVLALCRSKDIFRLELKQVRFHRDALELLLKIGLPAGLQSVMYSASNIIIQTSLNPSEPTRWRHGPPMERLTPSSGWSSVPLASPSPPLWDRTMARASLDGCVKACASVSGWRWVLRSSSAQSS